MKNLKRYIRDHERLLDILSFCYRLIGFNKIRGRKGLKLLWSGAIVKRTTIISHGYNNEVIINKGCRIQDCQINLFGNNNVFHMERDCVANSLNVWLQDNSSKIKIMHNTWFNGSTHLACIEGTKIDIGERCLFSSDVTIRTGDSHSIIDKEGNRTNNSKDVRIGNHVWVGNKVIILKGTNISDNCIIGTGTIVTGKTFSANSMIAGIPAKQMKSEINWDSDLL